MDQEVMSHTLGGLAYSRLTLQLHMHQGAAVKRL